MRTMSTGRSLSLGLVLTAGSVAALGGAAEGQTLNWLNAAGGAAATAGNWNPAQVPGTSNPLIWNLANTYTVTFSGAVPQSASHTFKRGTVTLNMTSPHTTSGFVRVGDVSGDSATTLLTAGTLHAGTGLTIGNASGATGTLTVDNEGALLDTTAAGSDIVVGNAGTGTLTIRDGASVVPADDFIVGAAATGVGTVTVTGTGGLPIPVPSSLLDLTGSGKDITVGSLGDGFFNVLAGARVNADEMFVGLSPGSNGVVNVGGIGGVLNAHSQINIATGLHLGNNPGVGLSGGSSTFTVNDDGIVTVLGTTRIGDPAGVGSGTLTVNQGGVFTTGSLIATDTGGFLNFLGGQIHVDGGSLQVRNDVLTLDGNANGTPVLFLENGAACTLSNAAAPFEALVVSNATQATLSVETGSRLTVTAGDVILGNQSGSNGQLSLRDTGTSAVLPVGRSLIVGDAGRGELNLTSGSHLTSGSVNLGRAATGTALVRVRHASTVWDITGSLSIGGTAAAAFGSGTMEIGGDSVNAGGTVNVTSGGPDTTSVNVWGAGDSLTVGRGGTLRADGIVVIGLGSDLSLDGGTIDCRDLRIGPTNVSVRGTVMGELSISGGVNVLTLSGDLLLTDGSASQAVLFNLGTLEVGNNTFTFTSANLNARRLGNCDLGAGGLLTSPMPLTVADLKTLSGDGTVDAPISNSGSILCQGGGLTFTKILSGIGQGISGTAIIFREGGGFTGSGVFSNATTVTAFTGSVITATGNLTMGSSASDGGFDSRGGRIVVAGDFDVTLNDSEEAFVGAIDFPNDSAGSPSVLCSTGLLVSSNRGVTGTGTIGGDHDSPIALSGTIDPGTAAAPGTIFLRGDTVGGLSMRTEFDIFSATSADRIETLTVSAPSPPFFFQSDIELNGTLELRVNPAHTPASGEEHTLIQCSGSASSAGHLSGSFHTIIAPRHWIITERSSGFGLGPDSLVAIFCPADFNEDGFIDFFDYDDFVACFETGSCGGDGGGSADFNGDGFVDFFDYDDFVLAFEVGC